MDVQLVTTDGQTSAVLRRDGTLFGVLMVTASTAGIGQLLWMVNPGCHKPARHPVFLRDSERPEDADANESGSRWLPV
ncbi:hypothetical protein [Actinoplanes sp. GCM10030250]|uniref:hypothetical protein n=1 Tax=Actinoplanes sp. GCM10030250 TaxID=3273376 RepID=UPI00360BF648